MDEKNYLKDVCICLLVVVLLLAVVAWVPEWRFFGINMKRANIFADLWVQATPDSNLFQIRGDSTVNLDSSRVEVLKKEVKNDTVRIEDFSVNSGMQRFYKTLRRGDWRKRQVRIAFLGDSYIEADIITEDLRHWLQQEFGGRGIGFVPVYSPAESYRLTVEHKSAGWKPYSMVFHQKADWKKLLVSGEYFEPSEGATFSVKATSVKGSDRFGQASFFFQNKEKSQVMVKVDGRDTVFKPEASDSLLQCIRLAGNMRQLDYELNNTVGFTGFGVFLDDPTGVYVDNFAVRGSSGIVLSIIDKQLMEQLRNFVDYDLVVLEFGLNVVMPEAQGYASYRRQMVKTLEHLKLCFPNASFMLVSVADRGYRNSDGSFGTKPGVLRLVEEQRSIAREAGIAFWNMFEAMGGYNSIVKFVKSEPSLANKDYTHINHLGGKKIAGELIKALQVDMAKEEQ